MWRFETITWTQISIAIQKQKDFCMHGCIVDICGKKPPPATSPVLCKASRKVPLLYLSLQPLL